MKLSELLHDIGRPVAYSPKLALLIGVKECVLLSQLIYWSDKAEEGWIYKSVEDLESETGLSYNEQLSARKALTSSKLMSIKHDRTTHRLYFKVHTEELDALWSAKRSLRPSRDTAVARAVKKGDGVVLSDRTTSSSVRQNRSVLSDRGGQFCPTEVANNTETTVTETTNKGAAAPGFNDFVKKWVDSFQEFFGEPYDVSMMGKDGSHLSRLLKTSTRTVDELIAIAKQAWNRHAEFGFGQSVTITGFCTQLNTIVAKLATNGKSNVEGTNRRENLTMKRL